MFQIWSSPVHRGGRLADSLRLSGHLIISSKTIEYHTQQTFYPCSYVQLLRILICTNFHLTTIQSFVVEGTKIIFVFERRVLYHATSYPSPKFFFV